MVSDPGEPARVPVFEFYIASSQTPALGFRVVLVKDVARAREVAENILRESPAYTGVEVRQASKLLFAIGSLDRPSPGGGALPENRYGHA
jgi:hypothetical protein